MNILNNTPKLQSLLEKINSLPEAAEEVVIQSNKTVTPTATEQIVTPDSNYDALAQVTVSGDANLVAENIAEGVSIFGVTGTHSGGSGEATETITVHSGTTAPIDTIGEDGDIYLVVSST